MIKILILFAVAALTTLLGVLLSADKKKKMLIFKELYEFNEQLLINLKYSRRPIDKIACNFKYIPALIGGKPLLDGKEGEIISDYFLSLGQSDYLSQIDYLNGRKVTLLKMKDESEANYKKYSSLYIKIFFLLGVMIAILLY